MTLWSKDQGRGLVHWSSETRTFLGDNNTAEKEMMGWSQEENLGKPANYPGSRGRMTIQLAYVIPFNVTVRLTAK